MKPPPLPRAAALPDPFARFLQYLEVERRCSPRTVEAYESDLLQLTAYLEETGADALKLDTRTVRGFLARMNSSRSLAKQPLRISPSYLAFTLLKLGAWCVNTMSPSSTFSSR